MNISFYFRLECILLLSFFSFFKTKISFNVNSHKGGIFQTTRTHCKHYQYDMELVQYNVQYFQPTINGESRSSGDLRCVVELNVSPIDSLQQLFRRNRDRTTLPHFHSSWAFIQRIVSYRNRIPTIFFYALRFPVFGSRVRSKCRRRKQTRVPAKRPK